MSDQTLAKLAQTVQSLDQRLQSLEAKQADIQRRAELVQAATKAWRPLLRLQSDLVVTNEAGTTARVPLSVCRTISAGRPLDLELRDAAGDMVELRDHGGRVLATLPRLALLALPRLLSTTDATQLLGLRVQPGHGQTVQVGETLSPGAATRPPHRPPASPTAARTAGA